MTGANDLSTVVAVASAAISLGSLIATIAVASHQNRKNAESRSAYIDLGVQAIGDEGAYATTVLATNAGPAPASQVMIFLAPKDGEEVGQGVLRLEPGEFHLFTFQCDTLSLERLTLSFMDDRGVMVERSWTPKSKSWPLRSYTLRAMMQRREKAASRK